MLKNKKGIIFGIANDHSIAWGIAKKLTENYAEIGITYQNNTLLKIIYQIVIPKEKRVLTKENLDLFQNEIKNIYILNE